LSVGKSLSKSKIKSAIKILKMCYETSTSPEDKEWYREKIEKILKEV